MARLNRDLLEWNLQPQAGRRSWHGGPTPVGALRGVSAEQARWAPTPKRKSIWQLTLDVAEWERDVALLKAEHQRLVQALRRVRDWPLDQIPPGGRRWTYGELLLGIAAHDAYHTGQIQLLKRLWQERASLGR